MLYMPKPAKPLKRIRGDAEDYYNGEYIKLGGGVF